jgi:hypothetical protein
MSVSLDASAAVAAVEARDARTLAGLLPDKLEGSSANALAHRAATCGAWGCVRELVRRGAWPEEPSQLGEFYDAEFAKLVGVHGDDELVRLVAQRSALRRHLVVGAARAGRTGTLRLLQELGALLQDVEHGHDALTDALGARKYECADWLVLHGCRVTEGRLHDAVVHADVGAVRWYIERGEPVKGSLVREAEGLARRKHARKHAHVVWVLLAAHRRMEAGGSVFLADLGREASTAGEALRYHGWDVPEVPAPSDGVLECTAADVEIREAVAEDAYWRDAEKRMGAEWVRREKRIRRGEDPDAEEEEEDTEPEARRARVAQRA